MKIKIALSLCTALLAASVPLSSASAENSSSDYWDILQLSSKYAWGIDTLDKTLLSTVFTSDARAYYHIVNDSPIKLDERLVGFEQIFSFLHRSLGHRKGTDGLPWHFVSNQVIEQKGDQADLRFYMHNRPGAAGGVYYMHAVRTPQGWRVNNMQLDEQIWHAAAYDKDPVKK